MQALIFIPFILQLIVIALDEVLFHIKRDLPKWERIGHPLDTLTVIACFTFAWWVPFDSSKIGWYVALALFSTLFVTKDEFVHKHHCPAAEQWLHAILFVNHSIVLGCLGLIWPHLHGHEMFSFLPSLHQLRFIVLSQLIGATIFCLYQVVYWNFIRRQVYYSRPESVNLDDKICCVEVDANLNKVSEIERNGQNSKDIETHSHLQAGCSITKIENDQ